MGRKQIGLSVFQMICSILNFPVPFWLRSVMCVDPYVEEGRANALLIHFLSTLLNIPNISCSLMYKDSKLAMKIEDIDYEDVFVKLQTVMLK